ncbi:MAG: phage baseplate assembly protein V [Ktedonobacteraceae bacterium]
MNNVQPEKRFYGKYRGVVTDNQDPLGLGRIRAKVPDVMGEGNESGWALPCVPFAGNNMGFFAMPEVGAGMWMEFEQGDPDYPIWSGCWWGTKEQVPQEVANAANTKAIIKTKQGHSILFDDTSGAGGITVQTTQQGKITLNTSGGDIMIQAGETGQITIKTAGEGMITVQTGTGQKITMQTPAIKLDNGVAATIEMSGPQVNINNGALEVM